jgi:hypothetical protein
VHSRRRDRACTGNTRREREAMTKDDCPKCGGTMDGPRYSSGQGCACHPEALIYTCRRCGYSSREPVRSSRCDAGDEAATKARDWFAKRGVPVLGTKEGA